MKLPKYVYRRRRKKRQVMKTIRQQAKKELRYVLSRAT